MSSRRSPSSNNTSNNPTGPTATNTNSTANNDYALLAKITKDPHYVARMRGLDAPPPPSATSAMATPFTRSELGGVGGLVGGGSNNNNTASAAFVSRGGPSSSSMASGTVGGGISRQWDNHYTQQRIPQYDAVNDRYCKFSLKTRAGSVGAGGRKGNTTNTFASTHTAGGLATMMGGVGGARAGVSSADAMAGQRLAPLSARSTIGGRIGGANNNTNAMEGGGGGDFNNNNTMNNNNNMNANAASAAVPINLATSSAGDTIESLFQKSRYRLLALWEELGTPEVDRAPLAPSMALLPGQAPTLEAVRDITNEIQRLVDLRNAAVEVEKAIELREGFLYLLQELSERFASQSNMQQNSPAERDKAYRELVALITPFRNASLQTVEAIGRWRDVYSFNSKHTSTYATAQYNNTHGGGGAPNTTTASSSASSLLANAAIAPYMWKGVSYLHKMNSDTYFLIHSRLGSLLEYEVRGNPLLDPRKIKLSSDGTNPALPPVRVKNGVLAAGAMGGGVGGGGGGGANAAAAAVPFARITKAEQVLNEEAQRQQLLREIGGGNNNGLALTPAEEAEMIRRRARGEDDRAITMLRDETQWAAHYNGNQTAGGGGANNASQQQQGGGRNNNKNSSNNTNGVFNKLSPIEIQNMAATNIQRVYKGHLARLFVNAKREQLNSAVKIQRFIRKVLARREVERRRIQVMAARKIQALYRGVATRERIAHVRHAHSAATLIQKVFRGYLTRKYTDMVRYLHTCAVKIQSTWRSYCVRQAVRSEIIFVRHQAATRIQAVWRGHFVRGIARYNPAKARKVVVLQAWFRGVLERKAVRELIIRRFAATRIQSVYRMVLAKRRCQTIRKAREDHAWGVYLEVANTAAVRIQSGFRMLAAKQRVRALREEKNALDKHVAENAVLEDALRQQEVIAQQHQAATKVQSLVRGHLARQQVRMLKFLIASSITMQRVVRGFLGRLKAKRQRAVLISYIEEKSALGDRSKIIPSHLYVSEVIGALNADGSAVTMAAADADDADATAAAAAAEEEIQNVSAVVADAAHTTNTTTTTNVATSVDVSKNGVSGAAEEASMPPVGSGSKVETSDDHMQIHSKMMRRSPSALSIVTDETTVVANNNNATAKVSANTTTTAKAAANSVVIPAESSSSSSPMIHIPPFLCVTLPVSTSHFDANHFRTTIAKRLIALPEVSSALLTASKKLAAIENETPDNSTNTTTVGGEAAGNDDSSLSSPEAREAAARSAIAASVASALSAHLTSLTITRGCIKLLHIYSGSTVVCMGIEITSPQYPSAYDEAEDRTAPVTPHTIRVVRGKAIMRDLNSQLVMALLNDFKKHRAVYNDMLAIRDMRLGSVDVDLAKPAAEDLPPFDADEHIASGLGAATPGGGRRSPTSGTSPLSPYFFAPVSSAPPEKLSSPLRVRKVAATTTSSLSTSPDKTAAVVAPSSTAENSALAKGFESNSPPSNSERSTTSDSPTPAVATAAAATGASVVAHPRPTSSGKKKHVAIAVAANDDSHDMACIPCDTAGSNNGGGAAAVPPPSSIHIALSSSDKAMKPSSVKSALKSPRSNNASINAGGSGREETSDVTTPIRTVQLAKDVIEAEDILDAGDAVLKSSVVVETSINNGPDDEDDEEAEAEAEAVASTLLKKAEEDGGAVDVRAVLRNTSSSLHNSRVGSRRASLARVDGNGGGAVDSGVAAGGNMLDDADGLPPHHSPPIDDAPEEYRPPTPIKRSKSALERLHQLAALNGSSDHDSTNPHHHHHHCGSGDVTSAAATATFVCGVVDAVGRDPESAAAAARKIQRFMGMNLRRQKANRIIEDQRKSERNRRANAVRFAATQEEQHAATVIAALLFKSALQNRNEKKKRRQAKESIAFAQRKAAIAQEAYTASLIISRNLRVAIILKQRKALKAKRERHEERMAILQEEAYERERVQKEKEEKAATAAAEEKRKQIEEASKKALQKQKEAEAIAAAAYVARPTSSSFVAEVEELRRLNSAENKAEAAEKAVVAAAAIAAAANVARPTSSSFVAEVEELRRLNSAENKAEAAEKAVVAASIASPPSAVTSASAAATPMSTPTAATTTTTPANVNAAAAAAANDDAYAYRPQSGASEVVELRRLLSAERRAETFEKSSSSSSPLPPAAAAVPNANETTSAARTSLSESARAAAANIVDSVIEEVVAEKCADDREGSVVASFVDEVIEKVVDESCAMDNDDDANNNTNNNDAAAENNNDNTNTAGGADANAVVDMDEMYYPATPQPSMAFNPTVATAAVAVAVASPLTKKNAAAAATLLGVDTSETLMPMAPMPSVANLAEEKAAVAAAAATVSSNNAVPVALDAVDEPFSSRPPSRVRCSINTGLGILKADHENENVNVRHSTTTPLPHAVKNNNNDNNASGEEVMTSTSTPPPAPAVIVNASRPTSAIKALRQQHSRNNTNNNPADSRPTSAAGSRPPSGSAAAAAMAAHHAGRIPVIPLTSSSSDRLPVEDLIASSRPISAAAEILSLSARPSARASRAVVAAAQQRSTAAAVNNGPSSSPLEEKEAAEEDADTHRSHALRLLSVGAVPSLVEVCSLIQAILRYKHSAMIAAHWREQLVLAEHEQLRQFASARIQRAYRFAAAHKTVEEKRRKQRITQQERDRIAEEKEIDAALAVLRAAEANEWENALLSVHNATAKAIFEKEIQEKKAQQRLRLAAIKIQCMWRCYNARFMVGWMRAERIEKRRQKALQEAFERESAAALKIQREVRMRQAMARVDGIRNARAAEKRARVEHETKLFNAALKIQCMVRSHNARYTANFLRTKKMEREAERMRAIKEAEAAQIKAIKDREENTRKFESETEAATCIQCAWRSYNARFQRRWRQERIDAEKQKTEEARRAEAERLRLLAIEEERKAKNLDLVAPTINKPEIDAQPLPSRNANALD